MFSLPKTATIIEVGPRDGLQNEARTVNTEDKLDFIKVLQEAGLKEMELTSFVSPKWVPQMADARDIVAGAKKTGRQLVLTPNERGITSALDAGADSIAVFVGVSNSFNEKNINKTTAQSMETLKPLIEKVKQDGIFVRACISTAFYCPFEGAVDPHRTIDLCRQFVDWGVDELSVADTIGLANPQESHELFSRLKEQFPDVLIAAHFHDTRRMALANAYAALVAGIDRFDASAGGLGGCPFAPGATGNVATEDLIHMFHRMGVDTGVDLEKLYEAISLIEPHVSNPLQTGMYTLYKNRK
ncbi:MULTISPECIES: hydroxymethylglutaryl-CoA lyase [unclassified Planococcus (in: firmicutes)]|uniref:hydroxymethylglutaryl-CoA lyase n=1 Tax=Planococcus TaxID=1372 RepID=UPI000C3300FC|nr:MULTISPECIES: hydroxymethylglutaryl-CoA lyase [unclassified Planococcus (in: firmicutes)]AUD14048.1 hydroxymethylglutaryl-CoA lyase [Planococcus sp. MB-3u-03]PKG48053.1 hydroxymethylglutaryl-CoA lyase [Planococcus sp. Urea-trap-24]PKG91901.1 hydroxymethylglutaryl-CoA lyase [Planococcus sp. Urea-3u-39]PKH43195.1 hydroxymethylglutaryl-CoA lyase [Planococcus sp. MB-3u-09]